MLFPAASKTKRLIHRFIESDGLGRVASGKAPTMLSHIDTTSLTVALVGLMAIALVFGTVLNAIVRENGFGPVGNALLFAIGFVGAAYIAGVHGVSLRDFRLVASYGLGGAFALFSVLALAKAGMARL
jgi:hypothetical protein